MGIDKGPAALVAVVLFLSCSRQDPAPPVQAGKTEKAETLVVVRQEREILTDEQRGQLGFPARLIADLEKDAGSAAEPFYEAIEVSSENLRGEQSIERRRLAGFSVRTAMADDIFSTSYRRLRRQGYLLFRSRQNYGSVPDVLTVIKGVSSYDILLVQKTEAPAYKLDTNAIIAWLKKHQNEGTFFLTGAGQDFVEARFVRQPADMAAFARKVILFAPDVLREGPRSAGKLAEQMRSMNGFRLVWD